MANPASQLQTFLENNRQFAKTWKAPPTMEQMRAISVKAGGGFIILTCLDPRCVPEQFFGPDFRAAAVRNAGGRATRDAVTSITVLRSLMHDVAAVFVVHHTDCGMTHLTDDGVRRDAKARTPDAAAEIDAVESYDCFDAADFEEAIRVDVRRLRDAKVLAGVEVRGLALDTDTGLVREIEV